jgi:hypothetical protein
MIKDEVIIWTSVSAFAEAPPQIDPCRPSPCGPNSQCRTSDNHAVCSCLQGYMGIPPSCRPECVVSAECPQTRACVNQKCTDPCLGSCGLGARCEVINHSPICSCREGQTGDPFQSCFDMPRKLEFVIQSFKISVVYYMYNVRIWESYISDFK